MLTKTPAAANRDRGISLIASAESIPRSTKPKNGLAPFKTNVSPAHRIMLAAYENADGPAAIFVKIRACILTKNQLQ